MPFVYILHSSIADKFYIGSTTMSPEQRLLFHQDKYYGNTKFTSKYKDWIVFHTIECNSYLQAQKIEKHIKKMKSKKYIHNIKKHHELEKRLLEKYI